MKKYLSRLLALLLALVLLVAPASALTVDEALELMEELYYYDIPDEAYGAESLDELIQLLGDPFSDYMSAEEYEAFMKGLEGDSGIVGIGVTIQYTEQGILIVDTISGGSAREAGFQPGDLIVEIDGVSCVPAGVSTGGLISGEEGSQLAVTILRDGVTSTHTLTRRPVIIPNTEIQLLDGGIGYIDCNSFGEDTGKEFAELVQENDGKVNIWLLDLRGNGGGYVQAAADMLNALLGPGRSIYVEYGDGSVEYIAGVQKAATAKPLIVLTDGGSASASEIVASNIRDAGRGITVGSRTYGKGVAQALLDDSVLPDYFDGDSLRLTIYRSYSAGMNTADKIGIIPTLLVDDSQAAAVTLALCGDAAEARLSISIGGSACFVDPNADEETIAALLSALPPQARVFYRGIGAFDETTVDAAAEKLGVSYESRWFTDVTDSAYSYAINAMGTYGLLNGTGGGKFNPGGKLTRAQLCVMLARVLNLKNTGDSLFSDVPKDAWYAGEVSAVAALGIVEGTGGGKFNPDGELTQEQFLAIMGRVARFINLQIDAYGDWVEEQASHLALSQQAALSPYSDWARSGVAVLAWGIEDALDGYGDMLYTSLKNLSPKQTVLREEAAAGMYAVLSGLGILL